MPCGYVPADAGNLGGLINYIDCQAQTIGASGYLSLAAPGSPVSIALTGLLTILIALYGYRLLLGETLGARDGVLTAVKVGIVLTLATSWPAYRVLVYDVALREPAELAASIGTAAALPGSTGDLATRLDAVDQQLQALEVAGIGFAPSGLQSGIAQPAFSGSDTFALAAARMTFLVGSVGSYAIVRLVAGLLLALGPLFAPFLLFDGTRGIFVGWLRGLGATVIGGAAIGVVLGVELVLLEPWLADLVARRAGNGTIASVPPQLLAVTLVFVAVLAAALRMAVGVTGGLSAMSRSTETSNANTTTSLERFSQANSIGPYPTVAIDGGRPRVAAIVDAVSATERREAALLGTSGGGPTVGMAGLISSSGRSSAVTASSGTAATNQSAARRAPSRVSASAQRRDRA